jgi:hypothetical protein
MLFAAAHRARMERCAHTHATSAMACLFGRKLTPTMLYELHTHIRQAHANEATLCDVTLVDVLCCPAPCNFL